MKYNFPETEFVQINTIKDQMKQIFSEVDEIRNEIYRHGSPLHPNVIDEISDLYHSIETLIRKNEAAFQESFNRVFEKNKARSYYSEPVTVTEIKEGYEPLHKVLMDALNQAQSGKGSERHGQGLPFEQQPIIAIPKLQDSDIGLMYQAIKKLQESQRMDKDAAIKERLGAINYIAASILFIERGENVKGS